MNIREIVNKKLSSVATKKFTDATSVYEVGVDSLDLVELVTELEEELGLEISDEVLANITKVKDVITAFESAPKA